MALFLVSGPFDDESSESLGDFIPSNNFQKLIEQCSKIFLMQSKDDPVVNFNELEKYQRLLPNAKTVIFEDRGHFNQEHFGEIVDLIKSL